MRWKTITALYLMGWAHSATALSGQDELNIGVMRALPGVFKVHVFGDISYSAPAEFTIATAELDKTHSTAAAAGAFSKPMATSDAKWIVLVEDLDRFVKPSTERSSTEERIDVECGHGSGFAVGREGILLTNRHVVEAVDNKELKAEAVISLTPPSCEALLERLVAHIGSLPIDPELTQYVCGRLFKWFGAQCLQTTKFRRAEVSIAYAKQNPWHADPADVAFQSALQITLQKFAMDPRKSVRLPVTVVARGGPENENDVAILRLEPGVRDAVICLPLADPKEIWESQKIFSLGFPGFKYDVMRMPMAELYLVSVESGGVTFFDRGEQLSLAQRVKLQNSPIINHFRKMLVCTALIREGSSGGPLVMDDGRVAGLNQAYLPIPDEFLTDPFVENRKRMFPKPKGDSVELGVPISVAQKLLAQQNIALDVGPTTQMWHEGLTLYQDRKYGEAEAKFRAVAERQVVKPVGKPYAPSAEKPKSIISHYVQDMIQRCEQHGKNSQ